jgi:hypothetical protein
VAVKVGLQGSGRLLHGLGRDGHLMGSDAQRPVTEQLLSCFVQLFPCYRAGRHDEELLLPSFAAFAAALAARRQARVEHWLSDNMR